MESNNKNHKPAATFRQIGVSRPPLEVEDLPTPEEVFKVKHIDMEEMILFVLGPSMIALGISIGAGEWLLGPLTVGKYGFTGIGWIILVSAMLQVFYNVELARYTLATGEPPVVGFGRTWPGYILWIPLALFCLSISLLLGGWTVNAGASLFALFVGRPYQPQELETVRLLGIGLLLLVFGLVTFGRTIERTMEIVMCILVTFVIAGLVVVTLTVVPFAFTGQALISLVTPAAPPQGVDLTLLGALAGYTCMNSGLNFLFIGLYRDKGYGMGYRTGRIAGIVNGRQGEVLASGKTFPEDEKNAALWKRWFRYLLIDQWGVYFTGCLAGIMAPCILVGYLAGLPGAVPPTQATIVTYAALQLGQNFGPLLFAWALLTGFAMLFETQIGTLEALTRNFTDGAWASSPRIRRWAGNDPRRCYFPIMLVLIVIISMMIHMALPVELIVTSANMANLASMIFPLVMIFLNRQLPRPARLAWWSYPVLVANVLFFGFFFVNFVVTHLTGQPLVRF